MEETDIWVGKVTSTAVLFCEATVTLATSTVLLSTLIVMSVVLVLVRFAVWFDSSALLLRVSVTSRVAFSFISPLPMFSCSLLQRLLSLPVKYEKPIT